MSADGAATKKPPRAKKSKKVAVRAPEPPLKPTPIPELIELYRKHEGEIKLWTNFVRDSFEETAPTAARNAIHSVRKRLKDPSHLHEKLERKAQEGRVITLDNFFDQVEDLGGVRVLTLYRWHGCKEVHEFIKDTPCWTIIGDPIAYAGSRDDVTRLKELGFDPKERERKYTSVHYVVAPSKEGPKWMRCEVQVRGLHLEGWAEVDHQLLYPSGVPGPLAKRILSALHEATLVTDSLAEFAKQAAEDHNEMCRRTDDSDRLLARTLADLEEANLEIAKLKASQNPPPAMITAQLLSAATQLRSVSASISAQSRLRAALGAHGSCTGCKKVGYLTQACERCHRPFCEDCYKRIRESRYPTLLADHCTKCGVKN